jgi:hypothetical protein
MRDEWNNAVFAMMQSGAGNGAGGTVTQRPIYPIYPYVKFGYMSLLVGPIKDKNGK